MDARINRCLGYRRILVPLDGSALAERALPFACRLAEQHGADLVLVRVVEPVGPLSGATLDGVAASHSAVGAAQLYLEELASRLPRRAVVTAVYYGPPVDGILDEISLRHPDLVVMATHGRTGLRVVLGSVADAVARQSPVPVLLVPPACTRAWEPGEAGRVDLPLTVLAPLDGSPLAEAALPAIEQLIQGTAARVTLYGVVQLVPALYYVNGQAGQMQDAGAEIDGLETYLHRQAARLSRITDVRTQVEFGAPSRRIAERARDFDVDLVVMATHGRGGLSRMLLGSVATSVLHQINVPLLLVRAQGVPERAEQPGSRALPRQFPASATA
jgi:nucleotide-binding universal stress UspA family protein